ncbi:methyltransferase domain-containing protein [Oxynema sp. CENA135]|uniref:class I SAM-dependent methyltransferase n=1 Tax=Oxynema sp. CENA135 TaxID=984206 RepID=UPI00190CC2AF|nr:class I SAM-dependent methyltransferase [Oxynema sp. CENA135]MBK4731709.1 methyltransferase domain-containing protein [Oxynema sp. CENA135]
MISRLNSPSHWYKQLFAWGMSKVNRADEGAIAVRECDRYRSIGELKRDLLGDLSGTVVEIGPGAGNNLGYYSSEINWVGIEPNPFMHPYLEQQAGRVGLKQARVHLGTAEKLPFEDGQINAVVGTYVLCSVENLSQSLQEILRVLKPGGQFIFVEHIAGQCGTLTRTVQNAIEPAWKKAFDGCNPNRETGNALKQAGFEAVEMFNFSLSIPIVSPHLAGIARKHGDRAS